MSLRITVLGAGPGGYVAGVRAAQLGAEVTVIEADNLGGTCLNWGCIPSKIMISTAQMLHDFSRAAEFGIQLSAPPVVDMPRLMARKERIVNTQIKGIQGLLKHNRVTSVKGRGKVEGPGRITVAQADGSSHEVQWDKLIVCVGTTPMTIPALPFDGQTIISSNEALGLTEVPESMVIVGGGVIGCEFACIMSALGTRVTIVEALERLLPLPSVDEGCSKILQREMKKRKVAFLVNKTVTEVDSTGEKARVLVGPSPFAKDLKEKDRKTTEIEADKVLVCIGRKSVATDIGLEQLGVVMDDRGWIEADDRMRTAAEDVFAVGDVLGPAKVMLAHVASTEGIVAAENAMGADRVMDYSAVPGAIFTSPEVANVGLTEAQAAAQKIDYRADKVLFRALGKAQVIGELAGEAKIVSEAETGRVLGVHIIGPHATDLIAEGTLAIATGRTVAEIAATIHAHPTLAEIMLEVSFKATDRALHG